MSIPVGATHKDVMLCHEFLKKTADGWEFWNDKSAKWYEFPTYEAGHFTERLPKQPQAWSGPEDGLPPVGTVCEINHPRLGWKQCEIVAHKDMGEGKPHAIAWIDSNNVDQSQGIRFRVLKTPEQLAADQRESAIRDVMDIAQVDCRVTAARLVDAGFKR